MLSISILSIHPKFVSEYASFGVIKAALKANSLQLDTPDLRSYSTDRHGSVDDRPYGGGDGMVMRCEPLARAIEAIKPERVIAFGPAGKPWSQGEAAKLIEHPAQRVAFVCGRFSGIDQRFCDRYVDDEYCIGDYVISGGELAALVVLDSIARLLPGGLGHPDSAAIDSFSPQLDGGLEYPLYTRPENFEGQMVPKILLSGDHHRIALWRAEQAKARTQRLRPDLVK